MKEIKETTYKGTRILLGNEKRSMIDAMCSYLKRRVFTEIAIPVIQMQETFANKVGQENSNMMFNFSDRGNRNICLAPEYTAVIQKLATTYFKFQKDVKLFYVQECFRGENPQAGRYRQFTQLGVEIINPSTDQTDILIQYASGLLLEVGISKFEINTSVTRGLDYYKDGKGFEITCDELGSSKQVCGGGAYDGGIGFAIGIDRLLSISSLTNNTNTMTYKSPQETLDEVAKEKNPNFSFQHAIKILVSQDRWDDVDELLHESMRRYADAQKAFYPKQLLLKIYDFLDTYGTVFSESSDEAEAILQQEIFAKLKQAIKSPSPSWVSDEKIEEVSSKTFEVKGGVYIAEYKPTQDGVNKFCHQPAFKKGMKAMRSLIFKEGRPKETNNEKTITMITNKKTKTINGRQIEYLDVIHNHTTTHFIFWDRIKILLGKPCIINTEIYTGHEECIVFGSESKPFVPRLIPKKSIGMTEVAKEHKEEKK